MKNLSIRIKKYSINDKIINKIIHTLITLIESSNQDSETIQSQDLIF